MPGCPPSPARRAPPWCWPSAAPSTAAARRTTPSPPPMRPAAIPPSPNTAGASPALGFACFSIRYRLAGDDPAPSPTPVLTRPEGVPLGRIAAVREIMGLPPATALEMARVMEAGIDDMVAAVAMVRARAAEFGVDPARVVLGGWSAGARCALYAAYAEGVTCFGRHRPLGRDAGRGRGALPGARPAAPAAAAVHRRARPGLRRGLGAADRRPLPGRRRRGAAAAHP